MKLTKEMLLEITAFAVKTIFANTKYGDKIAAVAYAVKTVLCLILNKENELARNNMTTAIWNVKFASTHNEFGIRAFPSWTQLSVGRGFFKNWHYRLSKESAA